MELILTQLSANNNLSLNFRKIYLPFEDESYLCYISTQCIPRSKTLHLG